MTEITKCTCSVLDEWPEVSCPMHGQCARLGHVGHCDGCPDDTTEGELARLRNRITALEAAASKAFKKLHSMHLFGSSGPEFTDTIHREVLAILSDALNGAQSNGGGRTPQTQGAVEGQEAREAQEGPR